MDAQGTATNASSIYVYEAAEVIAVRRDDVRIEHNPYSLFNSDQHQLRAISRWDLVVPSPKAVVRVLGVIP
jgi:hypothetical protein